MLPAKADPDQQKEYLEQEIQPRLDEAQAGKRIVLFVDAAHFVLAPFLGFLWPVARIFTRSEAPCGRQRLAQPPCGQCLGRTQRHNPRTDHQHQRRLHYR